MMSSRRIREEIRQAALSMAASASSPISPQKQRMSPTKILKRVLHPHSNSGNTSGEGKRAKRIRSGDDNDVIVIDSDSDEPSPSRGTNVEAEDVNLTKVLPTFRVGINSLA